jgi:hypothetical protein
MHRSFFLVLAACGSDPAAPAADAGPDPITDAGGCGPFAELGALAISEGGRAAIDRSAALADPSLVFEGDGLTVVAEEARLLVYPSYGATSGTLRVRCGAATFEAPVTIEPLAWSPVASWDPATSGPPAREYGAWWIDEAAPRGLFVFGGFHYFPRQFTPAWDLWFYDFAAASWTEVPSTDPPMAPGGRVAPGTTPGTLLYFGGSVNNADGSIDTPPTLRALDYSAASLAWAAAPFEMNAPGSYTGSFIRDERRDRWLSVCGVDARTAGIHCRVHQYTEAAGWSQVFVAEGPLPNGRYGFHYGYDEETDRVIVVAGQSGPGELDIIGDAWALELGEDPPRWVMLAEDRDDIRRRNGAFVLDPIGRRLFLWGGTADGRTSSEGLYALGVDRGREEWQSIEIPAEVPARTSGIGVYDREAARALFGFGNGDDIYTDLWALEL